jgi:hypothetical protein
LTDADTSDDVIKAYAAVVQKLHALTWQAEASEDRAPHVLTLTREAYEMYTAWLAEHYAELASPTLPDNLQDPWLKFEGIVYASRWSSR